MAAKIIVIFIAIWSAIQGFAYGITSILALLAHDCQISMRQSKLSYLMYIIYFRDRRCEPINWNIVADVPPPNEPIWPDITMVAFRTNILALIYLMLSTIWIITSLMLIVGCFMSCLGRISYYLLMMPWTVLCALTSILDAVAVGYFFYDLFNTLNMDSFVRHLEMEKTSTYYASLEINANILPMPAVIMLIVASRGLLFWCLNILSIPLVLSNAKSIIFGNKRKSDALDEQDFRYARNQPAANNNILESHFPPTAERSRYSDPSHYHQFQYDNMNYQQDKYDLSRSIGRRYVEPLKDESHDIHDGSKRKLATRNSEEKSSKKSSWSGESGNSASTINLAHAHQTATNDESASKHLHWREMPTDTVLKIERPHFRLPNKPSLLKKLSDSSYLMPDESHHTTTTQYASDELRSQLPWSYFDARPDMSNLSGPSAAIKRPKKSFVELRDDEDLPPVPVPDYTMNFSRSDRNNENERKPMPSKKFINPKRGTTHEFDGRE